MFTQLTNTTGDGLGLIELGWGQGMAVLCLRWLGVALLRRCGVDGLVRLAWLSCTSVSQLHLADWACLAGRLAGCLAGRAWMDMLGWASRAGQLGWLQMGRSFDRELGSAGWACSLYAVGLGLAGLTGLTDLTGLRAVGSALLGWVFVGCTGRAGLGGAG